MARAAAKKAVLSVVQIDGGASKHRTSALNLTHVPNYPKKLVIYQLAASPFWWVRYYADGKILRRSTKETDKRRAIEFAKDFYDEVNYKQRQGLVLNSRADFELCADALLEQQDANTGPGGPLQPQPKFRKIRNTCQSSIPALAVSDLPKF